MKSNIFSKFFPRYI